MTLISMSLNILSTGLLNIRHVTIKLYFLMECSTHLQLYIHVYLYI